MARKTLVASLIACILLWCGACSTQPSNWAPEHRIKIEYKPYADACDVLEWNEWDNEWEVQSQGQPCDDMYKAYPNAKHVP